MRAALVLALLIARPAFADGVSELVSAARRGDAARLHVAARRLGAPRLARLMAGRDDELRGAALAAAVLVARPAREAWPLLAAALPLLASTDRAVGLAAARVATAVARARAAELDPGDVDHDELARAAALCAQAARRAEAPPEARVLALECAVSLGEPADDLLADPSPDLRRAAVDLARADDPATRARLRDLALGDGDPRVAAAAAAAICSADAIEAARLKALADDAHVDRGVAVRIRSCLKRR